jgi:hypothetical protein
MSALITSSTRGALSRVIVCSLSPAASTSLFLACAFVSATSWDPCDAIPKEAKMPR